jgi:hypothetical protein
LGLFYPCRETQKYGKMSKKSELTAIGRSIKGNMAIDRANVATLFTKYHYDILVGFADVGYLSNPHKGHSQTGYIFIMGNTAISREVYQADISCYFLESCRDH